MGYYKNGYTTKPGDYCLKLITKFVTSKLLLAINSQSPYMLICSKMLQLFELSNSQYVICTVYILFIVTVMQLFFFFPFFFFHQYIYISLSFSLFFLSHFLIIFIYFVFGGIIY